MSGDFQDILSGSLKNEKNNNFKIDTEKVRKEVMQEEQNEEVGKSARFQHLQ